MTYDKEDPSSPCPYPFMKSLVEKMINNSIRTHCPAASQNSGFSVFSFEEW